MEIYQDFSKPYQDERITRNFAAIIADEIEELTFNDVNIVNSNLELIFKEDTWQYTIETESTEPNLGDILNTKDNNIKLGYEDLVDRIEEYINNQLLERIFI